MKDVGLIVLGALVMFAVFMFLSLNIRLTNLEKAHNQLVKALTTQVQNAPKVEQK